jgi:iron(II)-dependent oxidoreductase
LTDEQWDRVPMQPGVNLPAWELGHLAWFAEFWTLRGPHRLDGREAAVASRAPVYAGSDVLFDSARIAHADRWRAALPSRVELGRMLSGQLEATVAALDRIDPYGDADAAALYFYRLALFHEDMHGEAFAWLRSSLGYTAPSGVRLPAMGDSSTLSFAAVTTQMGWPLEANGFAFDNELPPRPVTLQDFGIDSTPVSAGQYLEFVRAGGYDDSRWWPDEAGRWRANQAISHPARWRTTPAGVAAASNDPHGTGWQVRWFDQWIALDPAQPVIHVNAWEAEAWCRWAGRRLPRAAEWEHAALSAESDSFQWGRSVWEWTADDFSAPPGFVPGPYREYSAPWFDDKHRELRGGCFATHSRMHHPRYRNFFAPARSDVFAGFRSAAT